MEHREGLGDLGSQSLRGLNQMKELRVLHLQKHASDLACQLGLVVQDQRVKVLTNHVLLCLGIGRCQSFGQIGGVRHILSGGSNALGLTLRSISHLVGVFNILLLSSTLLSLGSASIGLSSGLVLALNATAVLVDGAGDLVVGATSTLLLVDGHTHVVVGHGVASGGHVQGSTGHHVGHHGEGLTRGHTATGVHVHRVSHGGSLHGVARTAVGRAVVSTRAVSGGEVLLTKFLALVHGNEKGLGTNHLTVHLSDGSGSLLSGRVAHKGKSLADTGSLTHDAGRSDSSERSEKLKERLVSDGLIQVLDVQVHSLELGDLLTLGSI
mmetsp:Transcript_56594/g.85576  ORF Transcript_56594/g.85576 Transcript_56594/m.85576 type:complete len:324 (+) Transcript_56594:130-1101(+)